MISYARATRGLRRMERERPGALLARREKDGERHPRWSLAPGARALRRASLDGRNGTRMDAIPQERETGEL